MLIELAPNHKLGLPVANPVLIAGGMLGYGDTVSSMVSPASLGAVVIGPLMLHGQRGSTGPRLAELTGGFVLPSATQTRSLKSILRRSAEQWPRLGCPVVVQVADVQPANLAKTVEALSELEEVSGFELLLPPTADPELIRALVRTVIRTCELPLWVKVPLAEAVAWSSIAVEQGAVGIVVGQPPLATAPGPAPTASVQGALYGPLTFAMMFTALTNVLALQLPCAVIACGGIYTLAAARQALAAGAQAVQIDAALWAEPGLPARLAAACANEPNP